MKKTISMVLAVLMIFSVMFAVPFTASAQECLWTLYVDGQPYSTTASYYQSEQLKYTGETVYLNNFNGKTIEAIPGGYYGDYDAPVLNIDVTGTCTLTGDTLGEGTYGALYAEPRAGGAGKDSRVYIMSSNGGTLNITKRDYSYSQSSSTPKAYNAVTADEVVLGGTLNLNITTELYGVGTQASPKEVCGISASSLIAISNKGINNINVSAGTATIPRGGGIISEYPSYAKVYGIYSKGGTSGVRFGGAGGYTSIDISKTNSKIPGSLCIESVNTIRLSDYRYAVYLNAGKYTVSSPETITNAVNLKLFAADLDDFHYAAYLPKDITSNTALTEIKAKDVISSKLYKIGETPKNDTGYQSSGNCYVKRTVKKTTGLELNDAKDFVKFEDDSYYKYYYQYVPKAGYWCSAVTVTNLNTDSVQSENKLPVKPGKADYVYAGKTAAYILSYAYNGPKVQSYVSDSTVEAVGVVNFNVAPTGSDEGYTYQWVYGDSQTAITDSENVYGAKTKTLTISGTASNPNCSLPFNGQAIICKVSNAYGTYTTDPAVLTVKHSRSGDYTPDQDNHTYKCYCGEVISEKHTAKTTTTKATLTADGKTVTTCTVCKKTVKSTVIPKVSSIKLSATKYTYDGKVKTPTVTVKDSKGKTLVKNTDYTLSCSSGRKSTGKYSVTVKLIGKYSGTKVIDFYIVPGKTSKISVSQTTSSIKATWYSVTGATGYKVYLYKGSKCIKTAYTTGRTYTFSKLTSGTDYKICVKAYKTIDGKKVYASSYSYRNTTTKPGTPTLKAVAGTRKATLSWNKQTGADGYVLYMATSKTGKYTKIATLKGNSKISYTKTGLTKGKTYYFKVAAYSTVGSTNIYGAYSAVKYVKVK